MSEKDVATSLDENGSPQDSKVDSNLPKTLDSTTMAKAWASLNLFHFAQTCRFSRLLIHIFQLKQYFDDTNFPEWTKGSRGITQPLSFPEKEKCLLFDKERVMICLLCEETFEHPQKEKDFLKHLPLESQSIKRQF